MKIAVLQVADTGPLESLVTMLQSADYECFLLNNEVKERFRELGCRCVVDIDHLVHEWGYDPPMSLPHASLTDLLDKADLYVDVKHDNIARIQERWPILRGRTLWYRINGGAPEITPQGGDEINLICPIVTPNMWYREPGPWSKLAYVCWPPFKRWSDYQTERLADNYGPPLCLTHNLIGWGYGAMVPVATEIGIRCYGVGSPNGLVPHAGVPSLLNRAIALVHFKSSDAPGYSLYEALAAACPLIVSRRLIWRMHMEELLIPEETCLVFDRCTHDALSPDDVARCRSEILEALTLLQDPAENRRIGLNGWARLQGLMWKPERDGVHFRNWLHHCFS